ncbi:MAG: MFS transporter [Bacteriovoracaceae bacterium]
MKQTILISFFTISTFALIDNGRSAAYPFILKDFLLDPQSGSLIFTISALTALLTSLLSKYWLPTLGVQGALRHLLLSEFIGALLMGLSLPLNLGVFGLYLGSVLFGLGAGGATICMNLLITENPEIKNKKNILSGIHSVYALMSLLAPFFMNGILKVTQWYVYFLFAAILPLFLSLGLFGLKSLREQNFKVERKHFKDCPLSLKFLFGGFLALNVVAEVCVSSRLVIYFVKAHNYEPQDANMVLSLFFLCLFLTRFLGIVLFKNSNIKMILFLSAFSSFICLILGVFVDPIMLAIMAFPMGLVFPYTLTFARESFPEYSGALVASVLNTVSVLITLMHFLFGTVSKYFGIQAAITIPLIASGLSFILFYFIIQKTNTKAQT